MSNVHLDADGKFTVSAGDSTDAYGSLREALDAALPTVATHEKAARLRDPDTSDLNGVWRWLPATDVEPAAIGGVRIDAQAIREMADSLNTRPGPIPVDGGPTPKGLLASDVHGTASTGGGTPANGWAHWAVVVEGPTPEAAKLYLYAELVPEVAREVDAGRIATGSVHFGAKTIDGELPRDVELISHALTNDPAVKTLAPANSVRGQFLLSRSIHSGIALRARALPASEENRMSKRNAAAAPVTEPVREAAPPVADPPPPAEQRAGVAGLADEAAKDTALSQLMALLMKSGVCKEGDDFAAALAALEARLGGAAEQMPEAEQAASAEAAKAEERAGIVGLRSELATERKASAELRSKVEALEAREAKRAVEALVESTLRSTKRVMSDEDRATLVADLIATKDEAARSRLLKLATGAAAPTGEVMRSNAPKADEPTGAAPTTVKAATDACMDEARKSAGKDEPGHVLRARAQVIARKRFPEVFGETAES